MTIKTLTHIHQLMLENESARYSVLRHLSDAKNQAEDNEAPNLADLQKAYSEAWKAYNEALNALRDFEDHDWNSQRPPTPGGEEERSWTKRRKPLFWKRSKTRRRGGRSSNCYRPRGYYDT